MKITRNFKKRKRLLILLLFISIATGWTFVNNISNISATLSEIIINKDESEYAYKVPEPTNTLFEQALINSTNPLLTGYTQSSEIKSILTVDPTTLGQFADSYRSIIPLGVAPYGDDFIIFNRLNHNGYSEIGLGGLQVLKVNTDGEIIVQWETPVEPFTYGLRFEGGVFTDTKGNMYSLFFNGTTVASSPANDVRYIPDGTMFMLYGINPKTSETNENQNYRASLVNLDGINDDFKAINDLRVVRQDGNTGYVASTLYRPRLVGNPQTMQYGTINFDPDDPKKTTWDVKAELHADVQFNTDYLGAKDYTGKFSFFGDVADPIAVGEIDNGYYALISQQVENSDPKYGVTSLQIFNEDGSLRDIVKPTDYRLINSARDGESRFLFDDKENKELVYFEKTQSKSYIKSYYYGDPELKQNVKTLQTFPGMTDLKFEEGFNSSTKSVSYFGTTTSMTEAFQGFGPNDFEESGIQSAVISGVISGMEDGFQVQTLSLFDTGIAQAPSTSQQGKKADTIFKEVFPLDDKSFFVAGATTSKMLAKNVVFSTLNEFPNTYSRYLMPFYGRVEKEDDYSPAISPGVDNVLVDIDGSDNINTQLLLGKDKDKPIKVYDTVDNRGEQDQQELVNRINKNPNDWNLPIDWEALGFINDNKVGPNKVTYFATDSQRQSSSTTRMVNKVKKTTEYNEEATVAIDAENFVIDVADIGTLTKDKLIQQSTTGSYGNVLAWDLDTGANLNDSVVVDDADFTALKAATKFGRFPLKYTITRNGKPVTNSTTVFVKGDTEAVSEDEQYLISAHDFSVATKDYPTTEAALKALIESESKAQLFNVTTDTKMELSSLTITKDEKLPGPNINGSYVPNGTYKVVLSYGTKGSKSYVEREIKVTVTQSTSKMTVKQVYAEDTSRAIYNDLEMETTVDNTPTYTQDFGNPIQDVVDKLFTDKVRTLNYQGYDTLVSSAYTVYIDGVKVTPTPKHVPAEDFTVEFQYTGQLKFKDTAAQLEFGSIPITNSTTTTALTSESDNTVSIINTDLTKKWRLKTSVPDGINRLDNPYPFVGDLFYQDGSGEGIPIGEEAVLIEAQKEADTTLLSQVNLRVNQTTGLFLRQGVGNLQGSYSGKLVWILEDGPDPDEQP